MHTILAYAPWYIEPGTLNSGVHLLELLMLPVQF